MPESVPGCADLGFRAVASKRSADNAGGTHGVGPGLDSGELPPSGLGGTRERSAKKLLQLCHAKVPVEPKSEDCSFVSSQV